MGKSSVQAMSLRRQAAMPGYLLPALVVLGLLALTPLWVSSSYWMYLANTSLAFAIIAIGLNITNGYLGVLNLAVAGQIGLGAYVCAMLALEGVPVTLALICAAAAGGAVSAAIFAVFGRLEGFFFGLSTLAAGEIIRLLLRNLEQWTNGVRGLAGYPPLSDSPAVSFWILLATVAILLATTWYTLRSPLGLVWRAIRENSLKAASAGIRVHVHKLLAFTLSGAIIALGGAYFGLLAQFIDPAISDLKMLVQAVLMVALGGLGTIVGPVVGATAITLLPEMLRVTNELRLMAYGTALILVVLVLPRGVVGTLIDRKRARRIKNRRT